MHLRLRFPLVLAALALIAAACGGGDDEPAELADELTSASEPAEPAPTEPPDTTTTTTEAPETTTTTTTTEPPPVEIVDIGVGPYPVGATTITVDDGVRGRPLTVEVWFPLDPDVDRDSNAHRFSFITGDYYDSELAITAAPDAAAPDGPFPLVVYSHGSGGLRYVHSDFAETVASFGYVVIAADHTGNTAVEQALGIEADRAQIAIDRPNDIIAMLDAVTGANSGAESIAPLIDTEHIALTGHSLGGYTTYAVTGGVESDAFTLAADDRIDATITFAPAVGDGLEGSFITNETLGRINQPSLILVGTDDESTPVDPHVETAWAASNASPHYRAELVAGAHQSFTDVCDYQDEVSVRPDVTEIVAEFIEGYAEAACLPTQMPIERVKELTNTFAVTFLESVFRGADMISVATHEIPDDVIWDEK